MSVQDQIHMVAVIEIPISEENVIILSREQGAIILQLLFKKKKRYISFSKMTETSIPTLGLGVFEEY